MSDRERYLFCAEKTRANKMAKFFERPLEKIAERYKIGALRESTEA